MSDPLSDYPDGKPSPADFINYVPWACLELALVNPVVVTKVLQSDLEQYASSDRKPKLAKKSANSKVDFETSSSLKPKAKRIISDKIININAVYDKLNNLVQIEFDKYTFITRQVLRILGMILRFQPFLQSISIKCAIDLLTIPEISKFLPTINITDMCLDDTRLPYSNYHVLLENPSTLRYISLARCRLTDEGLKSIVEKLIYPLPSSKTICTLNLSTNAITDTGAKYIAEMLRSNRQLYYLNLSGNRLTDEGACRIFNTLCEFPMTYDEILGVRERLLSYLKEKNEIIEMAMREPIIEDRKSKSRSTSVGSQRSAKGRQVTSDERAQQLVEQLLGIFKDPFHEDDTFAVDGYKYCKGNNVLCYLNLSFNNVGYIALNRLLSVLKVQKAMNRKPRGLIKVSLDGNNIPCSCDEARDVEELLEMAAMHSSGRKLSLAPKKKSAR